MKYPKRCGSRGTTFSSGERPGYCPRRIRWSMSRGSWQADSSHPEGGSVPASIGGGVYVAPDATHTGSSPFSVWGPASELVHATQTARMRPTRDNLEGMGSDAIDVAYQALARRLDPLYWLGGSWDTR